MRRQVRQKKWIGGLIMGALSLGGTLLNYFGNKKSNQQQIDLAQQQANEQKKLANEQATANRLQQLNQSFNNTDYLNSYYDRFSNKYMTNPTQQNNQSNGINTAYSLRCGGKKKVKRCGGRNKAKGGKFVRFVKNNSDTIGSGIGQIGNIVLGGLSMANNLKTSKRLNQIYTDVYNSKPEEFSIQGYTGNTYRKNRDGFQDRFSMLKCGGKKKS